MRSVHFVIACIPALGLLTGCTTTKPAAGSAWIPGDPAAPSQVTPGEAIAIARTYTKHMWQPFGRNIMHGVDATGIRVDTPDASFHPPDGRNGWWLPGEVNEGIPYKWGGFDDPASFDQKIAEGQAGGDVSSPAKRMADNAAVSTQAAGVDCSGFVSRCLKLPFSRDSSQLPFLCEPLPGVHALRAGDLLNIPRRHVVLFAGWNADRTWIYYYETGGVPEWKAGLKQSPLDTMVALGYQPLRYRGMAREAGPTGKEVLTRAMRATAVTVTNPIVGDP
ncbi:MAG: hypothetical protein ACREKL_01135 [Chthoniobacterales bacterium]